MQDLRDIGRGFQARDSTTLLCRDLEFLVSPTRHQAASYQGEKGGPHLLEALRVIKRNRSIQLVWKRHYLTEKQGMNKRPHWVSPSLTHLVVSQQWLKCRLITQHTPRIKK